MAVQCDFIEILCVCIAGEHMLPDSLMVSFVSLSLFSINQQFYIPNLVVLLLLLLLHACIRSYSNTQTYWVHLLRHFSQFITVMIRIIQFGILIVVVGVFFSHPFFPFFLSIIYGKCVWMNRIEMQHSKCEMRPRHSTAIKPLRKIKMRTHRMKRYYGFESSSKVNNAINVYIHFFLENFIDAMQNCSETFELSCVCVCVDECKLFSFVNPFKCAQ